MKPPRRRTLAALGAGVAALHVGAAWQAGRTQPAAADAPPPRVMVVWLAQPEAAPAPVVAPAVAPPAAPAGPRRVPAPARRTDLAPAPLAAPDLPATEVRATSLPPTVLPPPLTLRYRLERGDTPAVMPPACCCAPPPAARSSRPAPARSARPGWRRCVSSTAARVGRWR
jgi:hypothetical protein